MNRFLALLEGTWHTVERWAEAEAWMRYPVFVIVDDPEAGSFTAMDFDAIMELR